jgi:Tfp pilus assembly protein PilN
MKLPINLASRPADTSRPLRHSAYALALLVVILAAIAVRSEYRSRNEFRSLLDRTNQVESRIRELESSQKEMRAWLETPQVTQIRKRSALLNSLISQKSLSWTRMFQDLEATLPAGARITSITPEKAGKSGNQGQPDLKLVVAAPTITPIVEFIKRLEDSAEFANPIVGDQRFPSESDEKGEIKVSLVARYVQKLEPVPDGEDAQDADEDDSGEVGMSEPAAAPQAAVTADRAAARLASAAASESRRIGGRQ